MQNVRTAPDHWNFELTGSGEFITPIGGNMLNDVHPVDGTLFDNFDVDDCERRFAAMAELGLNCLRQAIGVNHVFDPKTGLKTSGMKNWDTFITLAEKFNIWLMPVGGYIGSNDWFDIEELADNGRALDESCAFWQAFVGHYSGHPAIWAWDLRNELLFDNKPHMLEGIDPRTQALDAKLKAEWPAYLKVRYESVDNMNAVYGSSYPAFSEVPGSVRFVEKPFDLCAFDFRNYLNERGYRWCKRQVDIIHETSPNHMVCSGNNGWLSPDQDLWLANGFHNIAVEDLFDFVTFHPYPAWQAVPDGRGDPLDGGEPLQYWLNACIGMARIDHFNKPVVVQEFGWYGGGESRFLSELPYRSEEEHAEYMDKLCQTLIPHVNGFINWPLMDMPESQDISNHGGIFTHDAKPKALADVYEKLAETLNGKRQERVKGTKLMEYSLIGLYTCRNYQDRMWDDIDETLKSGEIPDFRFV